MKSDARFKQTCIGRNTRRAQLSAVDLLSQPSFGDEKPRQRVSDLPRVTLWGLAGRSSTDSLVPGTALALGIAMPASVGRFLCLSFSCTG